MSDDKQLVDTQHPAIETKFASKGGLIPTTYDQLYRLSQIMAASGMMPNGIKTVPAVFVAVEMGLEIGLSPMQAVQNIAVINGRPSLWGDSVLAIIRASGKLEDFDEYFEHENDGDQFAAVCSAKRKGEKKPIVRKFSVTDAKAAGLWGKQGPWQSYPKRMLQMRARSWALRDGFGDVLKGLHVAEEIMDIDMKERPTGEYTIDTNGQDLEKENPFAQELPQTINDFDALLPDKIDREKLDGFLEYCADYYKKTIDNIKAEASQDIDRFLKGFEKWQTNQKKAKPKMAKNDAQEAKTSQQTKSDTANNNKPTIFKQLQEAKHAVPELFDKAFKNMQFADMSLSEDMAKALLDEINRLADGGK